MKNVRNSTWGKRYTVTDQRESKAIQPFFASSIKENHFVKYKRINTLLGGHIKSRIDGKMQQERE